MKNGCQKGKRGEREAAKAWARAGLGRARRGRQYHGLEGRDVVALELDGIHIEVKRTEALSLYPAMEQAMRDANGALPLLLHRRNRKPWLVILPLDQLVALSCQVLQKPVSVSTDTVDLRTGRSATGRRRASTPPSQGTP